MVAYAFEFRNRITPRSTSNQLQSPHIQLKCLFAVSVPPRFAMAPRFGQDPIQPRRIRRRFSDWQIPSALYDLSEVRLSYRLKIAYLIPVNILRKY